MKTYIDLDRLRGLLSEVDTSSIVIIAIDFELTWNTKEVTEVGLSILNMDNVSSTTLATPMSPLSYADNLAKHIKSYHLRTAQYYKWVNRFPPGSNPDGFDRRFGNSERIPAAKLVRRMKEIMWGSGQDKVYILVGCALENEHETLYHLAWTSPVSDTRSTSKWRIGGSGGGINMGVSKRSAESSVFQHRTCTTQGTMQDTPWCACFEWS